MASLNRYPEVSPMHLNDDHIEQYASGQISRSGSLSAIAHLAGCDECRYRLLRLQFGGVCGVRRVPTPTSDAERRSGPRIHYYERAWLTRLNPLIMDRWPVHLLDISRGGLKVHVPEALPP